MGSWARVGAIARGELRRTTGAVDRRTGALLAFMAIAMALLTPLLVEQGLGFERGLYRVAATEDALLLPAIRSAPVFQLVPGEPSAAVDQGLADIGVSGRAVFASDTPKGLAALAALRQAAKDHATARFAEEPDQVAAFPVRVEVHYVEQAQQAPFAPGGNAQAPPPPAPAPPEGTVSGGPGGAAAPLDQATDVGSRLLPPERAQGTPATLAPPFPFRSLVLAYLFLVPMNFVAQMYAGSMIAERLQRRGEPLLASPARPWEIIVGKAVPYALLMMLISGVVALAIGAGWLSLLGILPVALAFLALSFLAALFARSFRELTFLTVFISVALIVYSFLPAVFASVHPIALVSPISLVVFDLRGMAPPLHQILYAVLPLTLLSLALFVLGAALLREEDLFHQKPVPAKALDALARQVRGARSGFKLALMLLPCVLVAELLLVSFVALAPAALAPPLGLVVVALVEEAFKGLPTYAAVARGALARRRAILFGALAGLGFFVGEKTFLLASLVGLFDVPAGAAVFGAELSGVAGLPLVLLVAPMALHMLTAGLTGWGAAGGKALFGAAMALAVATHTAYNAVVVRLLGGIG